MAKRRADVSFF